MWCIIGTGSLTLINNNKFGHFYLIEAVYNSAIKNKIPDLSDCYLLLTDEILFIIDEKEDINHRSFFLTDFDISTSINYDELNVNCDSVLIITVSDRQCKTSFHCNYQYKNSDRLIDYINQIDVSKNDDDDGSFEKQKICLSYNRIDKFDSSVVVGNDHFVCNCGNLLEFKLKNKSLNKLGLYDNKINRPNNNNKEKVDSIKKSNMRETLGQEKNFMFFVDPRISKNFTRYFQLLKKKLLNKGF